MTIRSDNKHNEDCIFQTNCNLLNNDDKCLLLWNTRNICSITNLKNHLELKKYLQMHKAKKVFLSIISIDDFGSICVKYGSEAGENILKEVAIRLNLYTKATEFVYKLRNSEFAVVELIDNNIPISNYISKIKYKVKKIFDEILILNDAFDVRAAIGASKELGYQSFIYADYALTRARANNLNFYCYDSSMLNKEKQEESVDVKDIRYALKNNLILVYYQPIVCNRTFKTVRYEALVRLGKKDGGVLTPYYFLDLSVQARLYNKVSRRVIQTVFNDFKDNDLCVSINISANDIRNLNTKKLIYGFLDDFPNPKRITFEVLETINGEELEYLNDFIKNVREYDCNISLDDFGSGFSNFNQLINIDCDYVKIDGQFIRKIFNKKNYSAINAIVSYCKEHNIEIVAEYVENKAILEEVKKLDIEYSQGHFFNKATPKHF